MSRKLKIQNENANKCGKWINACYKKSFILKFLLYTHTYFKFSIIISFFARSMITVIAM